MPENDQSRAEQDLPPRSQLVASFFDYLNAECVNYAVMNNYGDLPWKIPSDVDFTIPAELFARLDHFILDFAGSHDALVVQKFWHGNQKCAYILSAGPEGAREFVQLDFFVAFSTKGCPALLTHEELIADQSQLRNFSIPNPAVELLFVALRRLFKDDWSERHCARIAELRRQITRDDWLPHRYDWLQETLEAAVHGDLTKVHHRRPSDWAKLRHNARANMSLLERLANAALQTKRIAVRLRDETGQIAVVAGPTELVTNPSMEILEQVFHRRMHLDDATLVSQGIMSRIRLPAKLALLKRRKGLVFLHVSPHQRLSQTLAHCLVRLRLVDQQLEVAAKPVPIALKTPTYIIASTNDVVEAIVTLQAEKTSRAIANGSTQTSR